MARQALTFLQNYTELLFSLGKTNVCQLVFSRTIWQQAAKEKGMIDMEFPSLFHLSAIEKCLNLNPSDLDGGSRGRGMGAALRGAECCDLSCFQLHVLLDLQQVCYGGVDAVGFCCGQPRDNDEHVGIKKPYLWFTAQQE